MSTEEVQFFLHHLVSIIHIKRFADSLDQLCFQMERLWFYVLKRRAGEAMWWFNECAAKTLEMEIFCQACRDLKESLEAGMNQSRKVEKLLSLTDSVIDCYNTLDGSRQHPDADAGDNAYYRVIGEGEERALALSRFILSILSEVQQQIQ